MNSISGIKKQVIERLREKASSNKQTIVLVEGEEERVIVAAKEILEKDLANLILIGNKDIIKKKLKSIFSSEDLFKMFEKIIVDPDNFDQQEELAKDLFELRKNKGLQYEEAKKLIKDPTYLGVMLVWKGMADGCVSGAVHTTAETVRPALQIIKTEEGVKKVSGAFLMLIGDKKFIFSDCAINIEPTSEDLAETAILSSKTARIFDIEPKVAMLSFSTKGSAKHPLAEKVRTAVNIVKEREIDLIIDGEFQLDAAVVPKVAKLKASNSVIKGDANVLVFPDLQSGNIGYKLVERFAGAVAIGPILQGLKKPVNDLSRGCSSSDIVDLVCVTAIQSQMLKSG